MSPVTARALDSASTPIPPVDGPGRLPSTGGAGLEVVDGPHWTERLDQSRQGRTSGISDPWLYATPLIVSPVGAVIGSGQWSTLLYAAALVLALVILTSLVIEQAQKQAKRQRRAVRTGR
jgi:hypothetical protein